jgi:phosphoglycolate phosphatase-like HAD superfamily hydrolase
MIVICDLDGTLSDAEHRLHHIARQPRDYDAFFAASGDDPPIMPLITLVRLLADAGHEIHIVTGRSAEVRDLTIAWFKKYGVPYHRLLMRPVGDHTPDHKLKEMWFRQDYASSEILFALEDRERVVQMWRSVGVTCLQVAEGRF